MNLFGIFDTNPYRGGGEKKLFFEAPPPLSSLFFHFLLHLEAFPHSPSPSARFLFIFWDFLSQPLSYSPPSDCFPCCCTLSSSSAHLTHPQIGSLQCTYIHVYLFSILDSAPSALFVFSAVTSQSIGEWPQSEKRLIPEKIISRLFSRVNKGIAEARERGTRTRHVLDCV